MYYDKRIRYIDYLENGEKQRNCGYIKITVTGGRLLLEMQIKGLYATDDVASEVMLEGAGMERRIGSVSIRQGNGSFRWEIQDQAHQGEEILLNERLSYGQLERIVVHLSSRRSLYCIWRELQTAKPAIAERAAENAAREQALRPGETVRPEEQEHGPEEAVRPGEQKFGPEEAAWTGEQQPGLEEVVRHDEQKPGLEEMTRMEGQSMLEAALGISSEQGEAKAYVYPGQERGATQEEAISRQGNTAQEGAISQQGSAAQKDVIGQQGSAAQEEAISQQGNIAQEEMISRQRSAAQEEATSWQGNAIPAGTARREGEPEREISRKPEGQPGPEKPVPSEELSAAKSSEEPWAPKQEELHTAETQRTVSQEPPRMSMSEEKWQQLQRIYPHIRPFQDEREYLSLRPEDFVILRTNSYRLVPNGFLLHGF